MTAPGDVTTRIDIGALFAPDGARSPARLLMLMGSEPGRRYPLDGPSMLIGRGDECSVRVDDNKVSRQHARLSTDPNDAWQIEDLGSRNGVLVNGKRITVCTLEIGDRVQLSQQTLLLFTRADPLEDLVQHRQQMEAIGQLAAGIAHDFNNLLNVIVANGDHLAGLPPETMVSAPEPAACVQDMRTAAIRAAELTRKLLSIARRRGATASHELIAIDELVDDVLSLVRRTFDQRIRIEHEIQPNLVVHGDRAALHQLLVNLCLNSRDAMPQGGRLRVEAQLVEAPNPDARSPSPPGPQVRLTVSDSGSGMSEETRRRAFEPFFTTKEWGTGSGLGLAIVYEIATSHGGVVELDSELGKGASARVRLPARTAQPVRTRRIITARQTLVREDDEPIRARVLIVDDQDLVRRSLERLVRASGHDVITACDGLEALDAYASGDRRPDVVLLDLDMPNLSGADCLTHLRKIDPAVKVILISGYSDEGRRRRLLEQGALDFLAKPIEASALRECLSHALRWRP